MASRNRPKLNNMKKRSKHSYDHRGQTGKFGTIFVENPPMWSCAPGPHELAIVPYDTMSGQNSEYRKGNSDLNMPFSNEELESGSTWDYKLSVLLHYSMGINEDTVLCLRTIGRRCPICEERERLLREEGLDINSSDIQALTARKRVLYNIVCFDSAEEFDKGIQVWDAPHASIEDELSILVNKRDIRTGEIINRPYFIPEEGWNILFERTGKGLNTEYKYLEIKKRLEKDDFTDSELDELYDSVFNFEDIIEVKEYDVLYEMLHGVAPAQSLNDDSSSRHQVTDDDNSDKSIKTDDRMESRGRGRRRSFNKTDEPDRNVGKQRRGLSKENERNTAMVDSNEDPPCFGISTNKLDECEDCPVETVDRCWEIMKSNRGK